MSYAVKDKTVIREDTGQVVREHSSEAKARAHLRALEANVESQEAEWAALDEQAEGWLPTDEQLALAESAETAKLSVTPSPFSTSKTSNWIARVGGLPSYIQNVAKGIMKTGKSESQAIQMAIGVMRNWASGRGKVSPEVRAAAAKALAEFEAKRAASHAKSATEARWVEHDDERVLLEVFGRGGSTLGSAEHLYDEAKHPRGRGGKWIDAIGKLGNGEGVRLRADGIEHVAVHRQGAHNYRVQRLTKSTEYYVPGIFSTANTGIGIHATRRPEIETHGEKFRTAAAAATRGRQLHDQEVQRRKESNNAQFPETSMAPGSEGAGFGRGSATQHPILKM